MPSTRKHTRKYFLIATIVALIIALWSAFDMHRLYQHDRLWGYRPLALLTWSYFTLVFLFLSFRTLTIKAIRHFILGTTAGILLGLSFPPLPFLPLVIPAWVIIIYLIYDDQESTTFTHFRKFFHIFLVWNIIATYWISNTAFAAGIVAMFTNSLLMATALSLFIILHKRVQNKYHFILLAACWISFEYFHFRWEAHWPWLTLGHYLMEVSELIQWYSLTGVLGGTLWILGLAWLAYKLIFNSGRQVPIWFSFIPLLAVLLIPICVSIVYTPDLPDDSASIHVAIVQPNYEPHYVKRQIPANEEISHFLQLADQVVNDSTDYLVFPETSFSINLNSWNRNVAVRGLINYLNDNPKLTIISGLETNYILDSNDPHDQYTRTYIRDSDTIYWENHNTAVRLINNAEKELYYKSKLVPGAEFFPFKNTLFFLKPLIDKLGGSGSGLRQQTSRSVLLGLDGHKAAPIICYESVFGEYVSEYIDAGADWLTVMTNDGWWDRTAGHQQHLGLSVIRAIEQRKWIARAANSGISCFIDPTGSIYQATDYDTSAAIQTAIKPNSYRSFYSRYGDFIGRLAILILCGFVLLHILNKLLKRVEK